MKNGKSLFMRIFYVFLVAQRGCVVHETRYDASDGARLQRVQETKAPVAQRGSDNGEAREAAEDRTGTQEKTEASGGKTQQRL